MTETKHPSLRLIILLVLSVISMASQCNEQSVSSNPDKITFDLSQLDQDGLAGANPGGKVAIDYEYCIPADEQIAKQVQQIDPSLKIIRDSKGRIGCSNQQWLCLGNTHQKNWRKVLMDLSKLEFIIKVDQAFFE